MEISLPIVPAPIVTHGIEHFKAGAILRHMPGDGRPQYDDAKHCLYLNTNDAFVVDLHTGALLARRSFASNKFIDVTHKYILTEKPPCE